MVGTVAAVHGVSHGPTEKKAYLDDIPRPVKKNRDWTKGFNRAAVPWTRTHGQGCVDMNQLWKPFPSFQGAVDASDDSNYNWDICDACLAAVYANPALTSPLQAQVRLGHSRSLIADNPSFSAVPDNITRWAEVATHIMSRYVLPHTRCAPAGLVCACGLLCHAQHCTHHRL